MVTRSTSRFSNSDNLISTPMIIQKIYCILKFDKNIQVTIMIVPISGKGAKNTNHFRVVRLQNFYNDIFLFFVYHLLTI